MHKMCSEITLLDLLPHLWLSWAREVITFLFIRIFFLTLSTMRCRLLWKLGSRGWFNIKMSSYQYRKFHCGDKTILRPSYLHSGISYTGKVTSLYWIRALAAVPLSIFRSNSKFDENSECSSFKYTGLITTIFCTRHDSVTVVTCARHRCDRPRIFYTRVFSIFIKFRIRSKYA